jgi:uncharacterized protein (UPF0264 family)
MHNLDEFQERAGLLVSVRDASEAEAALAGGADVVDVKEPSRGSLGAADPDIIAAIFDVVAGRAPVSVAAGELVDWPNTASRDFLQGIRSGPSFVKLGLAGCAAWPDWPNRWRAALLELGSCATAVAVTYADFTAAEAPPPQAILAVAQRAKCDVLLVDTWDKSRGTVFDCWGGDGLAGFAFRVRRAGLHFVLAGSLREHDLARAVALHPTLVAVRGAVCANGRSGTIALRRVQAIRKGLDAAQSPAKTDVETLFDRTANLATER